MSMNESKKFWQTISESQINQKTSGGASRGLTRISAKLSKKSSAPPDLKSTGRQIDWGQIHFQLLIYFGNRLILYVKKSLLP